MSKPLHALIYLFLIPLLISASLNYYWREYTGGEIPEDALIGGQNRNGDNVYIGQVYVESNILLVTQINPGVKEVVVWTNNNQKKVIDKNIKILCGPPKNFVWFFNNGTEADGTENAILGGNRDSKNVLIGRIKHDGNIKIGSIYKGFEWGDVDDLEKRTACLYEVLLYQETVNSSTWEAQNGYYWREYDGTIPVDALPGGTDINGKNIFIGQASYSYGISVVRIVPGLTSVELPHENQGTTDKFIKILCGNPTNFEWISATTDTLQISLINKYAIIGGHDVYGYQCIGRISTGNEEQIGLISFYGVNEKLYFSDKNVIRTSSSYQVLTKK